MTRWLHFSESEMACQCGCGQMDMDEDFMEKLVQFRLHHGFKMPVTSGYRCDERYGILNPNSVYRPHKGHGVDIRLTLLQAGEILNPENGEPTLKDFGFTAIGFKKSNRKGYVVMHLDDINRGHGFIAWGY